MTSQDVLSLMKITSQRYGQTMVMITHNEEIAQLSDRIIRIEDGKITGKGVYCKIELPKVANGNWRMLHLQIGESCKAFARSAQERCSA